MSFSPLAQSSAYDVSNDWLSAWEFHTVMCHNGVMFRYVVTQVRVVGLRRFVYRLDWALRSPASDNLTFTHTR
jgi:hypothetical protein